MHASKMCRYTASRRIRSAVMNFAGSRPPTICLRRLCPRPAPSRYFFAAAFFSGERFPLTSMGARFPAKALNPATFS